MALGEKYRVAQYPVAVGVFGYMVLEKNAWKKGWHEKPEVKEHVFPTPAKAQSYILTLIEKDAKELDAKGEMEKAEDLRAEAEKEAEYAMAWLKSAQTEEA